MLVLKPGRAMFEKDEITDFPTLPTKQYPVGTLIREEENDEVRWYKNVHEEWVEIQDPE